MTLRTKLLTAALSTALTFSGSALLAQHDDHHDNGNHYGRDDHRGGPPQRNWRDDRGGWNNHYRNDAMRWRGRRDRPRFYAGYKIPPSYAIQPVPTGYYSGYAPLPNGYRYGYYDGYVVTYNPVTRIIADVLDLAAQ